MRNRNYYLSQIQKAQAKLGGISHMISINQDSRTLKNAVSEINDVLEQWSPYWDEKDLREPLSDNEYETSEDEEEYDNNDITEYDEYDEYFTDYDI